MDKLDKKIGEYHYLLWKEKQDANTKEVYPPYDWYETRVTGVEMRRRKSAFYDINNGASNG